MTESGKTYNTFAFISYSHRDMRVAKWLQKRLEGFRLPSEIHNDIDAKSRYLRPVFRDKSDLNPGVLSDELRKHLEESKFLVLICSASSAKSQWVSNEAKTFVELGRLDKIIPVIIPDGQTPEPQLFPIFLRKYFAEHPDRELLGVNIGEDGKEKALIHVVSRMLDLSFDSLWKRHLRQKRIRIATGSAISAAALAAAYLFAFPVSVEVDINPQASKLPTGEDIALTIDGAEYRSTPDSPHFEAVRVPGIRRFGRIDIRVRSQFFTPVDTTISTGFGIRRSISIPLSRDESFARFEGTVYDSDLREAEGVRVSVGCKTATTDSSGHFSILLPLSEQEISKRIQLEKDGYKTVVRDDEAPGTELKFIIHKL